MNSQRIRQLRLARGLSLEDLSAAMGGMVTKQALLKYEQGKARPTPVVLAKLAEALHVKAAHLWAEPEITVAFVAFRKKSRLPKKEEQRITNLVSQTLEQRVHLQRLIEPNEATDLPVKRLAVQTLGAADEAAQEMRRQWKLGVDPISSITGVLENHSIQMLQIDADEKFDGMAAVAYDEDKHKVAAAVVTRQGVPGDRQRSNLTHELGHLVLDIAPNVDEEKAAYRFGTAFLAPAAMIRQELGAQRAFIQPEELLLLKQRFGISVQALLHRLHDLEIITDAYYREWCIDINRLGWKKAEPAQIPVEHPTWLRRTVLRALSEGILSEDQADDILGAAGLKKPPLTLTQRRAFLKLPPSERQRILAEQAEKLADYYARDSDWQSWQAGDLIED
jgi:Zn-dependent peptidase ImmA (M78 family)/DNA-binding XRE family transcriptional regulator